MGDVRSDSTIAAGHRLPALDAMRGLVMALMAVDHVDAVVNPRHASADGAWMGDRGAAAAGDFLTRWCTHLCAPTFVFLAGVAIALSAERRGRRGGGWSFDRHLLARAAVLLGLEILVLSACFRWFDGGPDWAFGSFVPVFLQVLYAIGASFVLLVPLRRLPAAVQVVIVALLLVACDLLHGHTPDAGPGRLAGLLLVDAGVWSRSGEGLDAIVLYPALPWFAVMLLGHAVGRVLAQGPIAPRSWLFAGLVSLAAFAVLRLLDGFGNLGMHRADGSVLAWLRCSKYPPSLTFLTMELGLMAILLAAMTAAGERTWRSPFGRALLVLGRVPLFFYLVHLVLITVLVASGVFARGSGSWSASWLGAAMLVALALPLCAGYGRLRARGHAWTRYL
jgi:uncharacterized membrane protein